MGKLPDRLPTPDASSKEKSSGFAEQLEQCKIRLNAVLERGQNKLSSEVLPDLLGDEAVLNEVALAGGVSGVFDWLGIAFGELLGHLSDAHQTTAREHMKAQVRMNSVRAHGRYHIDTTRLGRRTCAGNRLAVLRGGAFLWPVSMRIHLASLRLAALTMWLLVSPAILLLHAFSLPFLPRSPPHSPPVRRPRLSTSSSRTHARPQRSPWPTKLRRWRRQLQNASRRRCKRLALGPTDP